jgi:transposase InsO family protein
MSANTSPHRRREGSHERGTNSDANAANRRFEALEAQMMTLVSSMAGLQTTLHAIAAQPSHSLQQQNEAKAENDTSALKAESKFGDHAAGASPTPGSESSITKPRWMFNNVNATEKTIKTITITAPKELTLSPTREQFIQWVRTVQNHFAANGVDSYLLKDCYHLIDEVKYTYPGISIEQAQWLVHKQSRMLCAVLQQSLTHHLLTLEPIVTELNDTLPETNNGGLVKDNVFLWWKAVQEKFSQNTTFNITAATLRLTSLTYNPKADPAILYNTCLSLQSSLTAAGNGLAPGVLGALMLRALPEELAVVKENLLASPTVTADQVYGALRRRFDSLKLDKKQKQPDDATLLTAHGKKVKKKRSESKKDTETGEPTPTVSMILVDQDYDAPFEDITPTESTLVSTSAHSSILVLGPNDFILDSGASRHSVKNKTHLRDIRKIKPVTMVGITNKLFELNTAGDVLLNSHVNLKNVLLMPSSAANIVSVARCIDAGCTISFLKTKATVMYLGKLLITFERVNGLYVYKKPSNDDSDDSDEHDVEIKTHTSVIPRKVPATGSAALSARHTLQQSRDQRNSTTSDVRTASFKPHSSSSKPSSGTHKRSGNRPAPTPAPAHLFTHARADDDDDNDDSSESTDSEQSYLAVTPNYDTNTVDTVVIPTSATATATRISSQKFPATGSAATSARHTHQAARDQRKSTQDVRTSASNPPPCHLSASNPCSTAHSLVANCESTDNLSPSTDDDHAASSVVAAAQPVISSDDVDPSVLHARCGHMQTLHPLANCVACLTAKSKRSAIPGKRSKESLSTSTLDTLCADLFGPVSTYTHGTSSRVPTSGGNLYGLLVIDEYSKYPWLKLLKVKSDAAQSTIDLVKHLRVRYGKPLKRFHSDQGGEFTSGTLLKYFKSVGTNVTTTTADTPQHNGLCEVTIGILWNMTNAMMVHSHAPHWLWGEAINFATYLRARLTSKRTGTSPYAVLNQIAPDLSKVKVFGCDAYVHHTRQRGKVDSRSWIGVYVGVDENKNCFRILNPTTLRITFTRDAQFIETSFSAMHSLHPKGSVVTPPMSLVHSTPVEHELSLPLSINCDHSVIDLITDVDESEAVITSDTESPTNLSPIPEDNDVDTPIDESKYDDVSTTDSASTENIEQPINAIPLGTTPLRRSTRATSTVSRLGFPNVADYAPEDQQSVAKLLGNPLPSSFSFISIEDDLTMLTYKQAMSSTDSAAWQTAIDKELSSLQQRGVYQVVTTPTNSKLIKTRWLFKVKFDTENQPSKFKARVVAKGFTQQFGIDYDDTYAPVMRMKSLRVILSIAAHKQLHVHQLDYTTAFLNAPIDRDIYVAIPDGVPCQPNQCWKLSKALYGLKQSPYCWNNEINTFIVSLGYQPTDNDPCLYTKATNHGTIFLCLYVDDTIVAYSDDDTDTWISDKQSIMSKYSIEDLGEAHQILNMKLTRDSDGNITLNQANLIDKMLAYHGMMECKTVTLPYVISELTSIALNSDDTSSDDSSNLPLSDSDHDLYRSLIGSALYLANMTRIDIAYTVNILCRYASAPKQKHWRAAKVLLRYLAGTKDISLVFNTVPTPLSLSANTIIDVTHHDVVVYSDASWGNDTQRKSTSGMLLLLYGNAVSWLSKKQSTIALSSTESEYMALTECTKEVVWMTSLLKQLVSYQQTALVLSDSQSAIAIASSPTSDHARTKHIDIRYHFIRDYLKKKSIVLKWVDTKSQLADILTKPVTKEVFLTLQSRIHSV